MLNDIFNLWPELEPAKWGDIALSQTVLDDMATLYFGINNVTDRQYAIQGSLATVYPPPLYAATDVQTWWPNAGRTIYFGVRASTDFHRMRLPGTDDMVRMQKRLYGAVNRGMESLSWMGDQTRGFLRF